MGNVLLALFQQANTLSDDTFAVWCLISLYAIIFISILINKREFTPGLVAAGIATAFVAIFLRVMELINDRTFFLTIAAAVIPVLFILFMKRE